MCTVFTAVAMNTEETCASTITHVTAIATSVSTAELARSSKGSQASALPATAHSASHLHRLRNVLPLLKTGRPSAWKTWKIGEFESDRGMVRE